MAEFAKHLYLILYPNEALVASQLTPEEFGMHYSVGSPRHFKGKVIFVEVKSGSSRLNPNEHSLKEAIENKRVRWHEYRVPTPVTRSPDPAIEPAL